ncbi:histone deacetylase family protein [Legionella gresilensis]|uniref:histone deacetylase family protein n=1 Tax=Legionella gresilensis TaxID=91823 RepID=UPI001040F3F5|nr:histone deacetylase family protein [Legionella gresilensis]
MLAIISHKDCLKHNVEIIEHPECPNRLQVVFDALHAAKLDNLLSFEEAPLAAVDQLCRVHDNEYVNSLLALTPKNNMISPDGDTILGPNTMSAALYAAGAVIKAVDLVMQQQAMSAFCNVRPPGHHAESKRSMGFCFFNNVAVGVAHALTIHQLKRVAIIDFDAHRGNGTEAIFRNNKKVLICSIYEELLYPFDKLEQADNIVYIPLAPGATGREFRAEITQNGLEKIAAFKPQMIFFSAGFDGHVFDSMSNLNLTEFDYLWITQQIKQIADKYSQNRMVSVLEGGYDLGTLGQCVVAHIKGMIGGLK